MPRKTPSLPEHLKLRKDFEKWLLESQQMQPSSVALYSGHINALGQGNFDPIFLTRMWENHPDIIKKSRMKVPLRRYLEFYAESLNATPGLTGRDKAIPNVAGTLDADRLMKTKIPPAELLCYNRLMLRDGMSLSQIAAVTSAISVVISIADMAQTADELHMALLRRPAFVQAYRIMRQAETSRVVIKRQPFIPGLDDLVGPAEEMLVFMIRAGVTNVETIRALSWMDIAFKDKETYVFPDPWSKSLQRDAGLNLLGSFPTSPIARYPRFPFERYFKAIYTQTEPLLFPWPRKTVNYAIEEIYRTKKHISQGPLVPEDPWQIRLRGAQPQPPIPQEFIEGGHFYPDATTEQDGRARPEVLRAHWARVEAVEGVEVARAARLLYAQTWGERDSLFHETAALLGRVVEPAETVPEVHFTEEQIREWTSNADFSQFKKLD